MKNLLFYFLAVSVLLFVSCNDITAQIGEITIKNNSEKDVTNFMLLISANTGITNAKIIEQLKPGKSKRFKYDLVNSNFVSSARTVTRHVKIEYYIDDKKFGMEDGNIKQIGIASSYETIITINADGWKLTEN